MKQAQQIRLGGVGRRRIQDLFDRVAGRPELARGEASAKCDGPAWDRHTISSGVDSTQFTSRRSRSAYLDTWPPFQALASIARSTTRAEWLSRPRGSCEQTGTMIWGPRKAQSSSFLPAPQRRMPSGCPCQPPQPPIHRQAVDRTVFSACCRAVFPRSSVAENRGKLTQAPCVE
jgi:hypothetical protein